MRVEFSRFGAGLVALAVVSSGCGQDPFSPPSRARPTPSTDSAQSPKATYLVMVSPGVPTDEFQMLSLRAQREANNRQAIFRVMGPGPDRTPPQPEVVRRAVADGASALIVMPGDSPELGKALAEAEAKGVRVIMLGRTIPAPDGSKPFTVVEHGDFDESARKIVEATLEDAKKVGQSTEGTALVMVNQATDSSSTRRVAALKAAAEGAGFRKVVMVPYEPVSDDSAKIALLEAVKANPDVSIVLGDDTDSTTGASEARIQLQGKPAFFVGGYMQYGATKSYLPPTRESCFVEGNFIELGALAVKTALTRLRGEPVQEQTVLPSKFTRGQGLVASAADLVKKKPMLEKPRMLGEGDSSGDPAPPEPKP